MTPRQQLVSAVTRRFQENTEYPSDLIINEIVEGQAQRIGGLVWQYYLNASDLAYTRLVNEAKRAAEVMMQIRRNRNYYNEVVQS